MANVDFSRNASVYDRRHGAILPDDAARQLVAGLRPGAAILDVGAGTGRVTLALTALGLRVIAIDPAQAMLDALRAKAAGVLVRLVRAEGGALPFRSGSFDAVVLSRILYLISDWRRVARSGPGPRADRNGRLFLRLECSGGDPAAVPAGAGGLGRGALRPRSSGAVSARDPLDDLSSIGEAISCQPSAFSLRADN